MPLSRRDVIFAAISGFVAWGLLVKWLPFLRLLGYAFASGVLVTILALVLTILTTARPPALLRDGFEQPTAGVAFLSPSTWKSETRKFTASHRFEPSQIYPSSFVISQSIETLITLVLRDFVSSWYTKISDGDRFVGEVERNIRTALEKVRNRIVREDFVNIVVSCIVPILTGHLRDFDQAERLVRGRRLNRNMTESEELDLAIAAKYRDGKLHSAASLAYSDSKIPKQEHLRKLLVRLLPALLPETVMMSRAVSVLIKEIVACAVLYPVLQMLSDPDTWNQIIEAYGRTVLQERKSVRRMRAALDEHASPLKEAPATQSFPRLAPNDSERAFERYVRAIRRTNNLSDARRFRSQVLSQLKRVAMAEGQDSTYIRRLETSKRVLDQKVAKLSTSGTTPSAPNGKSDLQNGSAVKPHDLSLIQILHTASGLSYFMEYMDRQHLMTLVQFWIVVDGFRNPLEDDFGEEQSASNSTWSDSDRMDIAQINDTYMSKAELKIPEDSRAAVRAFLAAGRTAPLALYQTARISILSAQSTVLEELNSKHFPAFRQSDLYYKFLASDEASTQGAGNHKPLTIFKPFPDDTRSEKSAPAPARPNVLPASKRKDLRRAALSTTDIQSPSSTRPLDDIETTRKSCDSESTPLFDNDYDTDPLANSTASIRQDSFNGDTINQRQVIESMEAAMNDIMTDNSREDVGNDSRDALFTSPVSTLPRSAISMESPSSSRDPFQLESPAEKSKPSLATLGLVNPSSRIGVFADNDLFPDEEKFIEDEYADEMDVAPKQDSVEVHEAAPGDLGLIEAITALSNDIERLVEQESVVDTLTRKAELTNNAAELRILDKSRSSLQREIRRKELQRQQYIIQESDNSLYGRSNIRISSVMIGKEDDGREFGLYVIEVHRQAGDQMPAATWAIARRYSEFHDLHLRLRRCYPSTKGLEFPRRRVVMKLQKQFLHNRRMALESYLQQLLSMPDVCRSRELRSFLSQQAVLPQKNPSAANNTQDIVTRIYNSVTDGMDDFLGNAAALDQLSAAGQSLISAANSQSGRSQPNNIDVNAAAGSVAEAEAELRAFEDRELEPFVKPICDIFLEIFELNRGNNWLRGRAVVVVLHQLLGGTVERKVRDIVRQYTAEDSILRYLDIARETMWPEGVMRTKSIPRTTIEKAKSKQEASIVLASLVPDLAGGVVGRANAQAAARRISATMNNERLNSHLVFTVLDEMFSVLFRNVVRPG